MGRKHLSWILKSALAGLLFAGLLLMTLSQLQTGIGFGRDVKVIIKTESIDKVEMFLESSTKNYREYGHSYIGANTYIFETSGVESVDEFTNALASLDENNEILHVGSFGSQSKRIANESFISIYLFTFVVVVGTYFTYRYRLMGLLSAFQILTSLLGALLCVFILGNPFTQSLWYTFNIAFMIYAFHKQIFLSASTNMDLKDFFTKSWFLKHTSIVYVSVVVLSALMFGFVDFRYTINGVFMMMSLILMFAFDWFYIYLGPSIQKNLQPLLPDFTQLKETHFFGKPSKPHRSATNFALLLTLGVILLSVLTAQFSTEIKRGKDFSKQTVLMVQYPTSSAYLEIQAILSSLGMFDSQTGYDVSDQGLIWISFDENVTSSDLNLARTLIEMRMNVKSYYFQTAQEQFPLRTVEFYLVYAIVTVLLAFLVQLVFERQVMGPIVIHSGFVLVCFLSLSMMFNMSWSRETVYMLWSIPMILSVSYLSDIRLKSLYDRDLVAMDSINTLVISASIAVIIGGVLIVVVPLPMSSRLSVHVLLVFAAIYFGNLLMHATIRLIERLQTHDDVIS